MKNKALMDKKQELLKQLFKARYHSVHSFFLKKLGSSEDAADASQVSANPFFSTNDSIKTGLRKLAFAQQRTL